MACIRTTIPEISLSEFFAFIEKLVELSSLPVDIIAWQYTFGADFSEIHGYGTWSACQWMGLFQAQWKHHQPFYWLTTLQLNQVQTQINENI